VSGTKPPIHGFPCDNGDRVQVQGQRAEISFCQQGTTIDVRRYRTIG
jgi:hypothetical protein